MTYMYLDDLRTPKTNKPWVVVRSFEEAVKWIGKGGCPDYISFDHDLGEDVPSGHDLAKWLVEHDLNLGGTFIPKGFNYNIHSANPVGANNIKGVLDNYLKFKSEG